MTQAQAEAPAPSAPAPAPDSPGIPALSPEMLQELAPDLRPTPVVTADDGDAADDSSPIATKPATKPDAAANAAPEGEADGDAGSEPSTPEQEVQQWADLILDNPNAASRVPRARLSEVFTEYNNRLQVAFDAGMEWGARSGMARAQAETQQKTLQEKVALAEQTLLDGDADGYREAVEAFLGGRKAYARVLAEMEPAAPESPESYTEKARPIIAPLARFPAAVAELRSTWQYPATPEGLQRLTMDVGRLLEKHEALAKLPSPEAQQLEQRQQAVRGLKATPKPDVSEGRTTPIDGLPFSLEDVRAGRVSAEEIAAAERTHPGIINRLGKQAAGVA